MKKIMLFFGLLFSVLTVAQNFPGKDVALLQGKELKVLPLAEREDGWGYKGFYTDPELKSLYRKGNRFTDPAALIGKVFKVVSYTPHYCNYVIVLENSETGTLYYDYHAYVKEDFPFEVIGGLEFPEDYFCDGISIKKKWLHASKKYIDEAHMPVINDLCLCRTPDDIYKMRVAVTVDEPKKKAIKGVKLFLENGEVLDFPEASIDVVRSGEQYNLIAKPRLRLDADLIQKLQRYAIVRKEIGSYTVSVTDGDLIKEYITCLAKEPTPAEASTTNQPMNINRL